MPRQDQGHTMLMRILALAQKQGMDTADLAKRSGLDREALGMMGTGNLRPTHAQYRRLKAALAVTGIGILPVR